MSNVFEISSYDEAVPAGYYKAEFISYEITDHSFQEGATAGQPRQQIQFVAKITDGEHEGGEVLGWCSLPKDNSTKLSPRSKLVSWAGVLVGDTSKIDLDAMLHKPCQIIVKQVQSNRNDGTQFSKIDSVFAVNGAPPAPAQPRPESMPDF